MKKLLATALLMLIVVFGFCQEQEKDFSLSRAGKKIQGVYIFLLTEPFYQYKFIATIEAELNWSKIKDEDFEKVIKKAKKKYPYFNGLLFNSDNFEKASLIQFDEEINRGGYSLGQTITFIKLKINYTGKIIALESRKNRASIEYQNDKNETKIIVLPYGDLNPVKE